MRAFAKAKLTNLQQAVTSWGQQRIFRDRLSSSIILGSLGLNILALAVMAAKLRPTAFSVPVHYSSIDGFDALGPWYHAYIIGFFGLGVTIVNAVLAAASFTRSRITSFFLLIGAFVTSLFCLIIATAFSLVL